MKVRYNEDKELVAQIKEGLRRRTDIVLVVWKERRKTSVCARNSEIRLPIPISRDTVTVCFITKKNKAFL